ncbi:MAG: hypothetical protein M5U01_21355 [Ardenticatenaceae bacterium]|nr:hypothetical protein [Ardenticatenaceae bacterium]HBY96303.1 hypothetical protein [Chloroflexota bacterium]
MMKPRIQVYTDPETKRRIELAAAKYDVPVTEYCLEAIMQRLADEDMLERAHIEIPVKQTQEEDLIAQLEALHERILARRGGRPIEMDIVEQVREERDYELSGVR